MKLRKLQISFEEQQQLAQVEARVQASESFEPNNQDSNSNKLDPNKIKPLKIDDQKLFLTETPAPKSRRNET